MSQNLTMWLATRHRCYAKVALCGYIQSVTGHGKQHIGVPAIWGFGAQSLPSTSVVYQPTILQFHLLLYLRPLPVKEVSSKNGGGQVPRSIVTFAPTGCDGEVILRTTTAGQLIFKLWGFSTSTNSRRISLSQISFDLSALVQPFVFLLLVTSRVRSAGDPDGWCREEQVPAPDVWDTRNGGFQRDEE